MDKGDLVGEYISVVTRAHEALAMDKRVRTAVAQIGSACAFHGGGPRIDGEWV